MVQVVVPLGVIEAKDTFCIYRRSVFCETECLAAGCYGNVVGEDRLLGVIGRPLSVGKH